MEVPTDVAAGRAGWIGRTETLTDVPHPRSVASMATTIGAGDIRATEGSALPPGFHWMMFNGFPREADLAPDGAPAGGGMLPPVPGLARMWAGGRLTWHRPMIVGRTVRRTSRVAELREKEGRSGPLLFVTLRHEIADEEGVCLVEEAEVVFRTPSGAAGGVAAPPAEGTGGWSRRVVPGPVMLFRFSALTYNAHRIHYDRPYATEVERYPGLLVQGPLIATLLLDLVRRNAPGRTLATFRFRAVSPLFDTAPFDLSGEPTDEGCRVRAVGPDGRPAMEAEGGFVAA